MSLDLSFYAYIKHKVKLCVHSCFCNYVHNWLWTDRQTSQKDNIKKTKKSGTQIVVKTTSVILNKINIVTNYNLVFW